MNSDCAFYIGTTHDVCQDYALAKTDTVVVSDGCSGSPYTDIGSRVLSVTAINKVWDLDSLMLFDEKENILLARPSVKMLGVDSDCLDATLLAATVYEAGSQAICCGDGVIAIKTKKGFTYVIDCAYVDSYPFYMNYLCQNNGRYQNWQQNHNDREVMQTCLDEKGEIVSRTIVGHNSGESQRLPNDMGLIRIFDYKTMVEISDNSNVEYIAIMSDGVHSFYETIETNTSRSNKSLDYIDVIKELLSFKNFNTSFVQRRLNKFRKNCVKKNWGNADDVSLAVIHLGEK
jgi:hypothetical protein